MNRRERLAEIAEELAIKPLIGNEAKCGEDLEPILRHFREDPTEGFDWCAAFVYHCVHLAGYAYRPRYPEHEGRPCLAGVGEWLKWDTAHGTGFYLSSRSKGFDLYRGDLVIYDDIVPNGIYDHIGVVLDVDGGTMRVAEGNVVNRSGVFTRSSTEHVNGRIRLPD